MLGSGLKIGGVKMDKGLELTQTLYRQRLESEKLKALIREHSMGLGYGFQ